MLDHARVHFVAHAEPSAGAPVPDITVDLLGWFDFFDTSGSGSLSQEQIVRALVSRLVRSACRTHQQRAPR